MTADDTTAPVLLGKYETRGVLGRGAMGVVYDGWDPAIGRRVAIKTIPLPDGDLDPETQEQLDRFRREGQAAGRLHHPNIVTVFDVGQTERVAYIVMEVIEGHSLKSILQDGQRLPIAQIKRIMQDLLRGLQYSHARGVVHRDIKPENLMLTSERELKIADFGIARIESSNLTQAGTMMGTPAYMSPEQFTGQPLDGRTDLYSAGVILYQLLTGERPFTGSLTSLMHKALNVDPPAPSALSPSGSAALDRVVLKAMAKRPDDRYSSADAFMTELLPALDLPARPDADEATLIVAAPRDTAAAGPARRSETPAAPRPAARPARNTPLIAASLGAGALVLAGVAWLLLAPARHTPTEPEAGKSAIAAVPGVVEAPKTPPAVPPPPSGADRLAALRQAVAAIPCSSAVASATPDGLALTGLAGAGAPETALHDAAAATPGSPPLWQVETFNGPYCEPLDMLADALRDRHGLHLGLKDDRTSLQKDDLLIPQVTLPDDKAHLQLDYIQHDGVVWHMLTGAEQATLRPAGAVQTIGAPRKDFGGWQVGKPFGTDMIIAITSSAAPLFATPRPPFEPATAYLPALKTALAAARRQGSSITAAATLVQTSERQ